MSEDKTKNKKKNDRLINIVLAGILVLGLGLLAYLYIEGYRPQAYSLSRTLTAEGPNVFKFTYSEVKPGEEIVETEEGTSTTTRRNTRRNNNSGNGQKAENAGSKKSGSSNKTDSAEKQGRRRRKYF